MLHVKHNSYDSFGAHTKFSEKPRNVSFSENFAYVLN